ncbi:D-hexose-6-phosphate mutarotase [Thiomicrospira sp. XS5]|uniref:D-hexose-6-phosphate mutarotase n=1 Tax=Thiomicrospira sp. XS5 TaxID=1775636 RepID=UPI000747ABD3|nr:D-hexose-6-phosphate mutarotase [Thiomicrospira sp. XS5]KUJ74039.1 D-hexose-6-phosphate mutarotase [Thiomicrospira sp. XS5]
MQSVEALQKTFSVEGVRFCRRDGLVMVKVTNAAASALLTTHGASVLSFTPLSEASSQQDWLWVSEAAIYTGEKPVRGGIPVCWPWFGPADKPGLPAHGFVRNQVWDLTSVSAVSPTQTELVLTTVSTPETLALWPHAFKLQLKVTIGESLEVVLTTHNQSDQPVDITEALHTYFSVSNAPEVVVDGLQGSECFDKLTYAESYFQTAPLKIHPPIDSVFIDQAEPVVIRDLGYGRCLCIEKESAVSSVVWNPGPEIIKGFADMDDQAWPKMLCVEAGNVLQNAVTVPPGSEHAFRMVLTEQSYSLGSS